MTGNGSSGSRRTFLKYAGAAVSGVSLAGCSGQGGSGDGSSGDGGSDGGSGDGGSDGSSGDGGSGGSGDGGGASTSEDLQTVRMVSSPFGFVGIVLDQMLNETNRLENRMNEAGYTVKAKETWESAALFAAGGPDFGDMSPLEAATIASERDLQLATHARLASFFTGWMIKSGGPYDTDTTGSVEASVQKIADQGKYAIGGWGGGDVQAYRVIVQDQYGLRFAETDSDFQVVTADYFALPKLVNNGEVASASSAPHFGAAKLFAEGTLEGLFWTSDVLRELGFGPSMLNSFVTTQTFADENPGAVEAMVSAWQDTVADFNSRAEELVTRDKYKEFLAVKSDENARWLVDWGVKGNKGYDTPVLYEDATLTEERIAGEREFIGKSAELGFIDSSWSDRLEFRTVDV